MKINPKIRSMVIENMQKSDLSLSKYACKNDECYRERKASDDIRPGFYRDIDRITYSLAYMRYIDKTQVFSEVEDDMISKRIIHVQLVSRVATTIGRALNLNVDLIEAAALGHDLGHTPFGHVGEKILNDISMRYNEGYFNHNVQSVRLLTDIEDSGRGSNISFQVLDAIFCHNGEIVNATYYPIKKTIEDFKSEYEQSYFDRSILKSVRPMTLEGCVVRISDLIAYLGRDIEDAVRLNFIDENSVPDNITRVLGKTNSSIIDTIVTDIINNSFDKNYIKMSDEVYNAVLSLMKFNYENIYDRANSVEQISEYKDMFNELCDFYLKQLNKKNHECDIYTVFLDSMIDDYNKNTTNERKVLDFVSGMTDNYFLSQYKKYCKR